MIPCGNEDNIVMQNRFKLSFCLSKNAQIRNAKFENFQHLGGGGGGGTAPDPTPRRTMAIDRNGNFLFHALGRKDKLHTFINLYFRGLIFLPAPCI